MENIISAVAQIPQLPWGVNLLDIIIVLIVCFYVYEGYVLGFKLAVADLLSFIFSFIAALKFYGLVAKGLIMLFAMPLGFANALGFFLAAFIAEIVVSMLFRKALAFLPVMNHHKQPGLFFTKVDHVAGMMPGMLSAFILLSFLLTIIVSLPSSPLIKHLVTGSLIGSKMVANTSLFENRLNDIFGGALHETLNFLTVEPQSDEIVNLRFKVANGTVDSQAEQEMFKLVNTERIRNGLHPLSFDTQLSEVARAHSKDMFVRGYFSHFTPDGLSPFDRMEKAGITYDHAGENLALAPSTDLAMQGLMNSPGHRANILSPDFGKIGIGVIDGGVYGKMYTQEFTN